MTTTKTKDCPRCEGAVIEGYYEDTCINCGWHDFAHGVAGTDDDDMSARLAPRHRLRHDP